MRISDWSSDVCSSDPSAAGAASGSAAVMARASASAPWSRMRFKAVSPVENRHPSGALCAADVAKVRGFPASTRSQREEVARAAKIQALTRRFAPPSPAVRRSEEHTSALQSLMRISYAVFCLKKKKHNQQTHE